MKQLFVITLMSDVLSIHNRKLEKFFDAKFRPQMESEIRDFWHGGRLPDFRENSHF